LLGKAAHFYRTVTCESVQILLDTMTITAES